MCEVTQQGSHISSGPEVRAHSPQFLEKGMLEEGRGNNMLKLSRHDDIACEGQGFHTIKIRRPRWNRY